MVKLETTKDRRRLHIGSIFVDLKETDYRELIRIFTDENVVKNILSNLPVIGSLPISEKEQLIREFISKLEALKMRYQIGNDR